MMAAPKPARSDDTVYLGQPGLTRCDAPPYDLDFEDQLGYYSGLDGYYRYLPSWGG